MTAYEHVALTEVVRGDLVEGAHLGSLVVLSSDGRVDLSLGAIDSPIYPRSCHKLLQATTFVAAGWSGRGAHLAIGASSHAGSPRHLAVVQEVLAAAGLTESDLQTPAEWPLDVREREALLRAGGRATPLTMDCSGKHAAMLATCVANGWPTADYLAAEHPLQRACRAQVTAATGVEPVATSVDGCGAPLYSSTLRGMALAYRGAVLAEPGQPAREVADAMRAHPDLVSGDGRLVTELMRAVPGLLAKDGAEAVVVAALPDGRALACKVGDGGERALPPVLGALLARWGHPVPTGITRVPVLGGGREVGEVRPVLG